MKAKELRIGNFIEHNYFIDKPNMVIELRHRVLKTDNPEFELINYEQVKPIILTDKWLFKFGFKLIDGELDIWNDDICYSYNFKSGFCFGQGVDFSHNIKIKYVHQLQNLYHALTGEELELNQPTE